MLPMTWPSANERPKGEPVAVGDLKVSVAKGIGTWEV